MQPHMLLWMLSDNMGVMDICKQKKKTAAVRSRVSSIFFFASCVCCFDRVYYGFFYVLYGLIVMDVVMDAGIYRRCCYE